MYRMIQKLQNSIDQLTLNGGSPDPPRRFTVGRPVMNAGYESDIPRAFRSSGLNDHDRQPKLGHTFDTTAPSVARDRDDPYNIPRALSPRDNDSRGSYPNKMMQESYLNQYRRN
nr:unnamed protein product [Callosobruchus analis]